MKRMFLASNLWAWPEIPGASRATVPWTCGRSRTAFTLIEMMAASTVLSLVLLLMVGMQDQMSRAWTNANRRTDAGREARTAFQMISADLTSLHTRQHTNMDGFVGSIANTNAGLPFVYYTNGGTLDKSFQLPNKWDINSCYLFGFSGKKPFGGKGLDLSVFGYYVGQTNSTNVNGFVTTNYNLYRYTLDAPEMLAALKKGIGKTDPNALFPNVAANSEIVARNTCNLRILFYSSPDPGKAVTNGFNYRVFSPCSTNWYSGSKIHVEFSTYPEDVARTMAITNWTNPSYLQKYARSFEFRVDVPRTITH